MDAGTRRGLEPGAVELWWWPGGDPAPRARRGRVDRLLRLSLARYLGTGPEGLRFGREPRGRPFLAGEPTGLDFNLSDTVDGTIVAVARGLRVGVDLERLDRRPPHLALARRWFDPAEAGALAALDAEAGRRAFLALWTMKEAACKATGTGIYGRLASWRFAVDGADPPALLASPPEAAGHAWSFHRLHPDPGHGVALVVRGGPPRTIQLFDGGSGAALPRGVPRRQAFEQ